MRSLRRRWPHIAVRRTWDAGGSPVWQVHLTPRAVPAQARPELHAVASAGSGAVVDTADAVTTAPPELVAVPPELVDRRGVRIGDLRIEEHRYRVEGPDLRDVDGDPQERAPVAPALAELATDPERESLRLQVVRLLALANGWFVAPPSLDISSARIVGQGLGELFDGVFIWRAQANPAAGGSSAVQGASAANTFIYVVAPDPQAKELLVDDPELARALIQVACPRPGDVYGGELEIRLQQAIARLGRMADPGRIRAVRSEIPDAGAVLVVKNIDGAGAGPEDAQAMKENQAKKEAELALSAELAELARKVGVRAVRRPASS